MTGYNINTDGTFRASPQSIVRQIDSDTEMGDLMQKRKRLSLQEGVLGGSSGSGSSQSVEKGKQRSVTMGPLRASPEHDSSGENSKKGKGKGKATTAAGLAGFTSCEACRRGKRRCEPSPLVPPDHPDAARLPCARCRRFAIECVRVKAVRRKGPAPVAVSDAVHGYNHDSSLITPDTARRSSALSDIGGSDFERKLSASSNHSPAYPLASPALSINNLPEGIDQVVPGPTIDSILNLFFDYVYPLTPCLHRPTFVADLTARRDRHDPVFFALTMSVMASTLVQIPRSLVNLDKNEVESLARKCIQISRAKMAHMWEDATPISSSMGDEGIVYLFLGNNTAHVVATAQSNQLALALRLNEESSYDGLDMIEREIRRRIYWLLFQADKSTACLRARSICLSLEDAHDLLLPAEVDDDMITPDGILPQPPGTTPLITGFNVNTHLFRILNDAIAIQRRKSPRSMEEILTDLQRLQDLRNRTIQTFLTVPDPLRMRNAYDSRSASPAVDWENKLRAQFVDFFRSAGDRSHALNSYLVMQTQQALLAQLAVITPILPPPMGPEETAENIACELLDGLNSLPVECVATNGPSLVQKVRFVGIHLMEASNDPTGTQSHS
uniref:Zn(2)-C6 fungal-type domain-containing protein n=1 Tax=Kwoniella dejecticola CBS 10117 TaxID=1296121 RepID=A0A1A6A7F2_9TREE|nr:uncharacterized protein I303_03702 [Kwoniella dejecticola CBS 10117]OBR85987.1 hypothetical protein I303_03702 [Kwoniella dejecticola CBS 10117]